MPSFKFWDIASDKTGTLFAVFERGRSSMHEFEKSSYDKLRLFVFKTDTGEKLFDRKWSAALGEHPSSESVALSDDGSILFLCRPNGAALSFKIR